MKRFALIGEVALWVLLAFVTVYAAWRGWRYYRLVESRKSGRQSSEEQAAGQRGLMGGSGGGPVARVEVDPARMAARDIERRRNEAAERNPL